MRKNYFLRWFFGGFFVGAAMPAIILLGSFAWFSMETFMLVRQTSASGQPIVIVTNPFIGFTNAPGGAPVISGVTVFIAATFLCGICMGTATLLLATLKHCLQKSPRNY